MSIRVSSRRRSGILLFNVVQKSCWNWRKVWWNEKKLFGEVGCVRCSTTWIFEWGSSNKGFLLECVMSYRVSCSWASFLSRLLSYFLIIFWCIMLSSTCTHNATCVCVYCNKYFRYLVVFKFLLFALWKWGMCPARCGYAFVLRSVSQRIIALLGRRSCILFFSVVQKSLWSGRKVWWNKKKLFGGNRFC